MDIQINNDPITDVDANTMGYIKQYYRYESWLAIAITITWESLILFSWQTGSAYLNASPEILLLLLALPFIVFGLIYSAFKTSFRHKFFEQFAIANNFTYTKTGEVPNLLGAIFQVGHGAKNEDIITGEINHLPLRLFNYFYKVKQGKSSKQYATTILEIDFQTPVPPLLLLIDKHYFGDDLADNNLTRVSKITLSTPLENHFSLFAETKFEIEALQIFTPEFLQLLYEKYSLLNLDLVDTKLYIYTKGLVTKKTELALIMEFVGLISGKLINQLPSMRGSLTALTEALNKLPNSPLFISPNKPSQLLRLILLVLILFPIILLLVRLKPL